MNKIIKNACILTAITLVAGICLGFVYDITKEPIAKEKQRAKKEAYEAVCPGMVSLEGVLHPSDGFSPEEVGQMEAATVVDICPENVLAAEGLDDIKIEETYLARGADWEKLGMVMNITTSGYGGDINFSMGFQKDGTINGIEILSISETAGLGMRATEDSFKGQFSGKKAESLSLTKTGAQAENEIDALNGATITSDAMIRGVNAGICYFRSLMEGGVFDHE